MERHRSRITKFQALASVIRYILFALLVLVGCKSQKEPTKMASESQGVSARKSIGSKPDIQLKRPSIAKGQVRVRGVWGEQVSVEFTDQQYFEVIETVGMGETVRIQPPKEGEILLVALEKPGIRESGIIQTIDVVFLPGEGDSSQSCQLIKTVD